MCFGICEEKFKANLDEMFEFRREFYGLAFRFLSFSIFNQESPDHDVNCERGRDWVVGRQNIIAGGEDERLFKSLITKYQYFVQNF